MTRQGTWRTVRAVLLVSAAALLLPAGGCALGLTGASAWARGSLESWSALPPPPSRPRRIDGATVNAIRIEAEDGKRYAHPIDASGPAWTEAPATTPDEPEGCPTTASYRVASPPGRIAQRACTEWSQHNEAGGRREYVLLDDGRLYTWSHSDSGLVSILVATMATVAGGIAGIVAAVLVGLRIRSRARGGA